MHLLLQGTVIVGGNDILADRPGGQRTLGG
jgi:hypothetical protein